MVATALPDTPEDVAALLKAVLRFEADGLPASVVAAQMRRMQRLGITAEHAATLLGRWVKLEARPAVTRWAAEEILHSGAGLVLLHETMLTADIVVGDAYKPAGAGWKARTTIVLNNVNVRHWAAIRALPHRHAFRARLQDGLGVSMCGDAVLLGAEQHGMRMLTVRIVMDTRETCPPLVDDIAVLDR